MQMYRLPIVEFQYVVSQQCVLLNALLDAIDQNSLLTNEKYSFSNKNNLKCFFGWKPSCGASG